MRERKSDLVRRLVREGDYKNALRIASNFKLGISKADQDTMKVGYECMIWPDFYHSIRVDVAEAIRKAVEVVTRIYGPGN